MPALPTKAISSPLVSKLESKIASMARLPHQPLWAGPAGAGPNGGVTQSMIGNWLACRERFRIKYVLGLQPADSWNKHIGYGNMWHVCEEGLASNATSVGQPFWLDCLDGHVKKLFANYPLQREEIEKWYNVCRVQFPEYVNYWSQHQDVVDRKPLMQEQVFDVPYQLPNGVLVRLRGKFDSVDLIRGGVWLQENKTKSDVDQTTIMRQLKFDIQVFHYLIALKILQEQLHGR